MKATTILPYLLLLSAATMAADYYVASNGSDNANGSQSTPWKTVSKGLSGLGPGNTLNVGAGTFTESQYIQIPTGVSLIGAGSDKTKILVNKYYNLENYLNSCSGQGGPGWDPAIDQFAIQIANGNDQTLKGFSMDGQGRANHGAIYMEAGDKVIFDDLNIQNFKFTAIWLFTSTNSEVKNSYFKDNTFGTGGQDAGNVMFHANTNLLIHDNTMLETGVMGGKGGYGIKSYSKYWVNACFWQPWAHNWDSWSVGMKIYNNSIIVPQLGTWVAGGTDIPDITIEFNGLSVKDCEIYNNYLTNHISLIGHATGVNSFNVHHNYFDLGQEYRYTMEADAHGIEFHHNYINGGTNPIAAWGNNDVIENLRVHHNVFYEPVNHFLNIDSDNFSNFKYYNNTLYSSKNAAIFNSERGGGRLTGADIKNNLFIGNNSSFGSASIDGNISNNGFQNVEVRGSSNITGEMKLVWSGAHPSPFFTLQSGSPAINAGVAISGYTDGSSGAPDLGAFEYGVTPWQCGLISGGTSSSSSSTPSSSSSRAIIDPIYDANTPSILLQPEGANSINGILVKGNVVGGLEMNDSWTHTGVVLEGGYDWLVWSVAVDAAFAGQALEVHLDSPSGTLLATIVPKSCGGWTDFCTDSLSLGSVALSGTHDLVFVAKPTRADGGVGDFDWVRLSGRALPTSSLLGPQSKPGTPRISLKLSHGAVKIHTNQGKIFDILGR